MNFPQKFRITSHTSHVTVFKELTQDQFDEIVDFYDTQITHGKDMIAILYSPKGWGFSDKLTPQFDSSREGT